MRFDLSDDEWALLEPLMPKSRKSARADDRKIMNAITCCAPGCRGAICRSAMGHIQRRTIASTAGLVAASGNGFLIRSHRDRVTVCI